MERSQAIRTGYSHPAQEQEIGKGDPSMANPDVLTLEKAAAFLRITSRTLYKLAKAGIIPSARIGASWRFMRADLKDYVRARGLLQSKQQAG